ncbi:hypothetical protein P308_14095 [Pseudomonas piscis]|nr:hypothetical protein P308_14095 [Pseudomonas piscis]
MLPALTSLLPFVMFAIVASITPGPTNLLVLSNSARYGLRAALPIIFGAGGAAAGMVWLVGGGLGDKLAHLRGATGHASGRPAVALRPGLADLARPDPHRTHRRATALGVSRRGGPASGEPQDLADGVGGGQRVRRACGRSPGPGAVR